MTYREQSKSLCEAVEKHTWDGSKGTSAPSLMTEHLWARLGGGACQIDSITQSWGVLSSSADPERGKKAMQSVVDLLVRKQEGLDSPGCAPVR